MNNRISRILANRNDRKLLVPFLTVGYPNYEMSERLCDAVIASGADMLELGIPFSDPLADGPQVQLSSQIALEQGTDLDAVFKLANSIRKQSDIPLIAMGYFNPIYSRGVSEFVQEAIASGIDGLIIPDLPPEEAGYLIELAKEHELSTIFLVAPTSSKERVRLIEQASSDFVYAVTVTGVTGAGASFDTQTDQYLARLRRQLKKPFVAGFGVSTGESAVRLCQHADGVVIGSALIREIEQHGRSAKAVEAVTKLLKSIRESLDR
jgi:tryptophan synthase alpha chain